MGHANPVDAPAHDLDAVVAVVDRHVVTRSEIEVEARLFLLARRGPAGLSVPLDEGLLRAVRDTVILQELLAIEARRTPGLWVREADVERGVVELRARFVDDAAWRAFVLRYDLDDDALRAIVRRNRMVAALLEKLEHDDPLSRDTELQGAAGASGLDAAQAVDNVRRERHLKAAAERVRAQVEVRVVAP
jgi:hypothetical protein